MDKINNEQKVYNVCNVENDGMVVVTYNDFEFRFFAIKQSTPLETIIKTKDKYIECTDGNGEFLYIHCGCESFKMNSTHYNLRTTFYIVSNGMFNGFDDNVYSFRFSGQIINKIFPSNALTVEDRDGDIIKLKRNKYSKSFDISICDKKAKLTFYSGYQYQQNIENGLCIKETESSFDVIGNFYIKDLFTIEHNISRLLSFLLFRQNCNNYSIDLLLGDREVARCYYKQIGCTDKIITSKHFLNNIYVTALDEVQFEKLFDLLTYKINDKEYGINLDFIPTENDVNVVSKNRVKDTVSAIECVMNKLNFSSKSETAIEFVEHLKEEITNCEKIDNDIRKQFINSLKFANYPIKKRIYELYKNKLDVIKKFIDRYETYYHCDFSDVESLVKDTVKYRDENTHNEIGLITKKIVDGVLLFDSLIYATILGEIGFENSRISDCIVNCIR